jgi:steroid delta-isomerase-like uncharacterized protein
MTATETTERNKAVIRNFLEAWNNHRPEDFDNLVAADVVRHCQATPAVAVQSLDQLKQFFQLDTEVFPDSVQTPTLLVAEGDLVAAWVTYEGTQKGPMGPLPALGARTKFDFGAVFRLSGGKISEWWVTWDNITILRQLGHIAG